jgi:four helix bundle protein
MLRIYEVMLEALAMLGEVERQIGKFDRELMAQLQAADSSVLLNLAEGSGSRGGTRRARYDNALGSARETQAILDLAVAKRYVSRLPEGLRPKMHQVIGTLVHLVH